MKVTAQGRLLEPELPDDGHLEPTATIRRLTGPLTGLIMWTLHLGAIYAVTAILHHHGAGDDDVIGRLTLGDTLVIALTIAAAIPTAWAAWAGWRGWRRSHRSTEPVDTEDLADFGGAISVLANVLFLFAIVLEGIGVLWLPS